MGMSLEEYAAKQTKQAKMMVEEYQTAEDWKDRLVNEYYEIKKRYNKLKKYNRKQTIQRNVSDTISAMPSKEEYRNRLMSEQQSIMGRYLEILELRLTLENIEYDS